MMRSRSLALALLSLTLAPAAVSAQPAPVDEARQSFERGLAHFDRGEHRAALRELERAYELAPSYRIFYNIGQVNVALGDSAAALTAFQRYLREGAARVPAARREQVEREIARLSQRAAALVVDVDVDEATIAVDGRSLGQSPLPGRVWLNPGSHRVTASARGETREQSIDLSAGDDRVLRFELEKPEAPALAPAEAAPESPPANREESSAGVPWVAWGITGALAVGAGVTGGLALSARSTEQDLKDQEGVSKSSLEDARSDVARWALVSDVFLAATVVSAGVSLYLTLDSGEEGAGETAIVVAPGSVSARFRF